MAEFYPTPMPHSYRVAPSTDILDVEILASKNIETINATFENFAESAMLAVTPSKGDDDRLQQIRRAVPSDLVPAFDNNPAAVARLLASWTYVNQAPFHEHPNLAEYLRGDRPNWALVGARLFFERDIEDDAYEELLDFATGTSARPAVQILLGPAGYGVSTLLMGLAARLVNERAGPVFMLKPGCQFLEGDIEFASSALGARPYFFVDNAADFVGHLSSAIGRLRDTNHAAMFLLGERLNEWRQARNKPTGKEFDLNPLSDPEINRLLDYLGAHSQLNALEHLSRDMQFSVVKEKHRKELLIVMREATEGKSFDAILEDEYRGIVHDVARRLYLTVCCFYQHGAYVRDSLLAQLSGVSVPELYEVAEPSLEGVVIFDCLDEAREMYAARARHRTIAAVVWERCGEVFEREQLLQSALTSLNLNYKADKDAFDDFVRSDRIVNSIRTLEGKTRFFETAVRKDPNSPYVRQHYARMLLREEKGELALNEIEAALKLGPGLRVLYHSKGMILQALALSLESVELARRRMAQSEEAFRQGLSMNERDEYCYQGLSQLYLGWAKRSTSPEEEAEYVAKAEEIINEGMRKVRVRDGLWIESANIEDWLGNQPSRVDALEKAVASSPGSIVPRYLLGRVYRRTNQPQKAVDIIRPIVNNYHDEYRAFMEYALALIQIGRPYKEAIAVLRLSTLYGLSDPRFISTLGGMLFMDGDFTEASKIFAESTKHNFSSNELNGIEYRPADPLNPEQRLRIEGVVAVVKSSYCFIDTLGYGRIICPGSKFGGMVMDVGLQISFEPAFSPRGCVADRPRDKS